MNLTILSRPVKPRATRTALIVASVPELTMRTSSTEGTASQIRRASSTSSSVGAPKLVPLVELPLIGDHDLGVSPAEDHGSPRRDEVDELVAVDVPDVRALARGR